MRRWTLLSALLTLALVLCDVQAFILPFGVSMVDAPRLLAFALLAGIVMVAVIALDLFAIAPLASYVAVHIIGALLLFGAMSLQGVSMAGSFSSGFHLVVGHGTGSATLSQGLLVASLTWELAYVCAWLVLHEGRVWLALALTIATLLITGHTQRQEGSFIFLCATGLCTAYAVAVRGRYRLRPRFIATTRGVSLSAVVLVPIGALIIGAAWIFPSPAPLVHALPLQEWSQGIGGLLDSSGLGANPVGDGSQALASFGGNVRVGGNFHPDATEVFDARLADPGRSPYWRGAVYDVYRQGSWVSLPAQAEDVASEAALPLPSGVSAETAITAEIRLIQGTNTLVTAGLPLHVSVPSVAFVASGDSRGGVLMLKPHHGFMQGTYTALSLPTSPSVTGAGHRPALSTRLREADLRVPALPSRVRRLAERLVTGERDPYAQAWAIQRYLRGSGGYVYDMTPPQAMAGEDPTDYFLFESKRGFCTHFASAMVILAREAGIPARLITGYAAGHLVNGRFLVTAADAHAWPELWIAGYGWITFEPTPAFPTPFQTGLVPQRPVAASALTRLATGTVPATRSLREGVVGHVKSTGTPNGAVVTATSTVVSPVAGSSYRNDNGRGKWSVAFDVRGLLRWARPEIIAAVLLVMVLANCAVYIARGSTLDAPRIYRRMTRLARRLGKGPRRGQTPLEWAADVGAIVPEDQQHILRVVMNYTNQTYSGERMHKAECVEARTAWRLLRRRWLLRLVTRQPLA